MSAKKDSLSEDKDYVFSNSSDSEMAKDSEVEMSSEEEEETSEESREESLIAHAEQHISGGGKYIKSIIYGGLDGIVSVFVTVAAVSGSNIGVALVLILGLAKLLAGAISMGVGDWLSTDAAVDKAKRERKREEWECENFLEGEIEEMVQLYVKKGVPERNARKIMHILAKDRKIFVDIMMAEELGITTEEEQDVPWKHGLVNFTSFMIFGTIPLIIFIIFVAAKIGGQTPFYISIAITLLTLVGMGYMKGRLTGSSWIKSAIQTVLLGSFTAFVGWLTGFVLHAIFPDVNI